MKRHVTIFTLLLVLLTLNITPVFAGSSTPKSKHAPSRQAAASSTSATTSDQIKNADSTMRNGVAAAMNQEADSRGLAIDLDTFAYSSRDDVTVANASVQGIQDLSEDDFAAGADVAFVYLSLPSASNIPVGFYTMKAFIPKGSETGEAQLIDAAGKIVAKVGFRLEIPGPGTIIRPVLTIEIGFFYICIDLHFRIFWIFRTPEIKLCIVW